MKLAKVTIALFGLSLGISQGAGYILSTGSTANSNGFADSSGKVFQNSASGTFAGAGTVSFGIFNTTDAAVAAMSTGADLIAAFRSYPAAPGTFTSAGLSANAGTFSVSGSAAVTSSQFSGQNMYLFIGNGTSYALSTQFLVLKTTFTFDPAVDALPTATTDTLTSLTVASNGLLIGSTTTDVKTTGTDATVTPGWRTASLVPESSTALLGALGALGLLRRRR
ncbi:MAG: hypothetical protein WCK77_07715 [Verrucomicrobiota bacterium]